MLAANSSVLDALDSDLMTKTRDTVETVCQESIVSIIRASCESPKAAMEYLSDVFPAPAAKRSGT